MDEYCTGRIVKTAMMERGGWKVIEAALAHLHFMCQTLDSWEKFALIVPPPTNRSLPINLLVCGGTIKVRYGKVAPWR